MIRFGGEQSPDILAYRHTYWKMTNLNSNWGGGGSSKAPSELKKIFHRSGPISWKMMASGKALIREGLMMMMRLCFRSGCLSLQQREGFHHQNS